MATKAAKKAFTDEQRRTILAEAAAPGATVAQVLRKHQIAESTFYNWKQQLQAGGTKKTSHKSTNGGKAPAPAQARSSGTSIRSDDHMAPVLQDLRALKAKLTKELQRVTKAIEALEA